jgi:hypothetical protein
VNSPRLWEAALRPAAVFQERRLQTFQIGTQGDMYIH